MKLKTVEFDEDQEPEFVTAQLTLMEAATITRILGRLNDFEIQDHGCDPAVVHEIFSALNAGFFNRFYQDGYEVLLPAVKPKAKE